MAEFSLASVALSFAAAGWHVAPALAGLKRPATRRGVHDATRDPDRIRQWWKANPRFNVMVDAGRSGVVVVDCDMLPEWPADAGPRPSGIESGADVLLWLAELEGHDTGWLLADPVPQTLTPSGGIHFFFRAPEGRKVGNSVARVGPGIDVRAAGGYVIAPWSQTLAGHYRPLHWPHTVAGTTDLEHVTAAAMRSVDVRPSQLPVLPDWLAERAAPTPKPVDPFDVLERALDVGPIGSRTSYAATALQRECADVAAAANGGRNERLHLAAVRLGQLVGAGMLEQDTVESALTEATSLPGPEATATMASGLRFGMAHPREVALR